MERNVKGIAAQCSWENPHNYTTIGANHARNLYTESATASVESSANVDRENGEDNTAAEIVTSNETAIVETARIIEIAPATVESAHETIILPAEIVPEMSTLADYTDYIKGIQNRMKKDLMQICVALFGIRENKLYTQAGYKTVVDYAMAELGYSRDTVNKYISVAELFIENTGEGYKSVLVNAGEKDFSVGALIELLPLRKENDAAQIAKEMVQSGEINPEMASSEIRKIVKAKRGKTSKKNSNYSADKTSSVDESNGVDETELKQTLARQNEITRINEQFKSSYDAVKNAIGEDNDDMIVMLHAQREMSKLASSVEVKTAASVDGEESEIEKLKKQLAELQAENEKLREDNQRKDSVAKAQAKTIENLMASNREMEANVEIIKTENSSLKNENDKLKTSVEVEETIGEEKVISKGGKIIAIVNDKLGITFKYTKKGSHVWYQGGKQSKQITRDKAYQILASVEG